MSRGKTAWGRVVFKEGRLTRTQTLAIANPEVRKQVEILVNPENVSLDKRFVYYLLGATGVCTVPLSSFATDLQGLRVTLLEKDEEVFRQIFKNIAESIRQYLDS